MSLIIYHRGAIYADRMIANKNSIGTIYTKGDKLFISPNRRMAFVVCGNTVKEKNLKTYFHALGMIVYCVSVIEKIRNTDTSGLSDEEKGVNLTKIDGCMELMDDTVEKLKKLQDGRMFVITKKKSLSIELGKRLRVRDAVSVIEDESIGYGSGQEYWNLLQANGMPPEECYKHIADIEVTISKEFDTISQEDLEDWPKEP